jgi:hypothetical protein
LKEGAKLSRKGAQHPGGTIMGLYMRDNGVYYIKADFDGSKLKFSTRTRDPDLAGSIFQEFLKTMVQYKMNGHLAKQSGLITYSMPVQADVRPAESTQIISFKEHYEEYIQLYMPINLTPKTIDFILFP